MKTLWEVLFLRLKGLVLGIFRTSPQLGEIRSNIEIGYARPRCKYIWIACSICGRERWVRFVKGKPRSSGKCKICALGVGIKHRAWQGGQYKDNGYIFILKPQHPYAQKHGGYVNRARLVLEEKLGRYLLPDMHVHHINGIRDDDRPENLLELSNSEHAKLHKEFQLKNK